MSLEERPMLRLVEPGEAPAAPVAHPVIPTTVEPSAAGKAFTARLGAFNTSDPLQAAYMACVGASLAEDALDIYAQAAAYALPGVFRRGVPPGLRSAEATRAWLGSHLEALARLADTPGDAALRYDRAGDLRAAVALAGTELERAVAVAEAATELRVAKRRDYSFADKQTHLGEVSAFIGNLDTRRNTPNRYLAGTYVLAHYARKR